MKIRHIAGWSLLLVAAVFSAVQIAYVCSRSTTMVLLVNGKEICSVNDRMTVDEALVLLDMKYRDMGIVKQMGNAVTYGYSIKGARGCDSAEELSEMIYEASAAGMARAYCVSVGKTDVAVCSTYANAKKVADELTDYIIERIDLIDDGEGEIRLTTDISVRNCFCFNSNIGDPETVIDVLLNRSSDGSESSVSDGSRITAHGHSINANEISGGSSGNKNGKTEIDVLISSIGYRRIVTEKITEITSPDTEYIESDKVYVGNTQILYEGESGISENEYETVFEKGKEISRKLIGSQVISASKNKVVRIGTKPYPAPVPTGTFSWPVKKSYVISSFYSESRGKLDRGVGYHLGIDIAGYEIDIGEPVYAADGGEVVYAEKLGTYGNFIRIKHEDGVETCYAHLSKFDVKAGDKVFKGQKIGEIGMTGQTTGPHLHFEVRIDGKTADPLVYLPKMK